MQNDIYNLYDNLVAASILNVNNYSKETGKIIFGNFNKDNPKHLFIFNTALISCMYNDIKRIIYLDMPFFEFIKVKWPNRKRAKIKRYKESFHFEPRNEIINIEEILEYMADAYDVNIDVFDDIFEEYYNK